MSDLHKLTLREVMDKLADVDNDDNSDESARLAYQAIDRDESYQIETLIQIAKLGEQEPWAASLADNFLTENGL